MRTLTIALLSTFLLSGCGSSFSPRPPVVEDKVGILGKETVGTLATAPDYRVVYVRLDDTAKLCAEAPADAGAQFASTFAGVLSTPSGQPTPLSFEAKAGLAVAMKQLFKRSQGVQFYRDGAFALCNMYLNDALTKDQYISELQQLRISSSKLIEQEIPFLEKITIDPITAPSSPKP